MRRALLILLIVVAGCAGTKVRARTGTVDELIKTARANGARRCAPVELAMAEAHNDFAKEALSQGNYFPAKREAAIAEQNARAAVEKSPKDLCNPTATPPDEPKPSDFDGDGILDTDDDCPRVPEDKDGFEDQDGCPEDDNDSDGIADKIDDCPNEPEDRDGTEDTDGCPDPDNDGDGIADKIDQCPDEAEDKDGFADDDGCPDCDNDGDGVPECPQAIDKCPAEPAQTADGCPQKYTLIVVTQDKIELSQTVYFDTRKATIKRVSFRMLDEVAQALADNPTIKVRIEGHTDSQGSDKFNMKLSGKRADSVRKYLIARGVDGFRMAAQGFGETVPIADNRTKDGRAQNRRVEFFITER
ncbi:MAG: OmpA family protein [Myxococcales bacterium]|nr:OmpA family protein [Myxococcales bacterium]